jgi:hypothetical protein
MSETPNQSEQIPATVRAEVLLDQMGERVGRFLSTAGQEIRKATARAREEAEDIWAEAQNMRRSWETKPPEVH